MLDGTGEKLNLSFLRGGVRLSAQAVSIVDGVSPLVQTADSARTLILFGKDGRELSRQQIELKAGEANEIRV